MNTLVDAYKVYLSTNFSLYVKTHGAHFNVTGMFFPQLHELFQNQYEDLIEAHDSIGENIRKLDAFTPASLGEYRKLSAVDDQEGVTSATDYVERLLMDHERIIAIIRIVFNLAAAEDRQDHMNFLADRLDKHGKHRWMLKTLLSSVA
jgi:starvation-inducible DNA-binding protein